MNPWDEYVAPIISRPESAGLFGSLLSLRWAPGKTWPTKFFAVGSGAALTVWGAPAVVEFYGITSIRYAVLLAFFCGFGGPYMLAAFAEYLKALKWREVIALVFNIRDKR